MGITRKNTLIIFVNQRGDLPLSSVVEGLRLFWTWGYMVVRSLKFIPFIVPTTIKIYKRKSYAKYLFIKHTFR